MNDDYKQFFSKYNFVINKEKDVDFLIDMLKEEHEKFTSRNAEFSSLISKLNVTPDSLSLTSREALEKFAKLQDAAGIEKLNLSNLELSFLEFATEKYKCQNKERKLQDQLSELLQLTDIVNEDIEKIGGDINFAQSQVQSVESASENELEKLNLQIKAYKDKLLQYINKYPWVDGPQYNLLNIHEEIKKLFELQNKVEALETDLQCYEGLKPDLIIAKQQLSKLKSEYEDVSKMIADMDHLKL